MDFVYGKVWGVIFEIIFRAERLCLSKGVFEVVFAVNGNESVQIQIVDYGIKLYL